MSEELKPCPFCGGRDLQLVRALSTGRYVVECRGCRKQVYLNSVECMDRGNAIKAWNRRAGDERMQMRADYSA
ncbi:MAG: Lar family restriction alleviation protein [Schwartzia sp.]|nr:Lar family restriction alleviation protein [Schwartzia sp. (in: firmicutes)]